MFPQFPQTSHFPAYFHSSATREQDDGGGPEGGAGRGARVVRGGGVYLRR